MSDTHGQRVGRGPPAAGGRLPVLIGKHTYGSVTDKISDIVLTRRTPWFWWAGIQHGPDVFGRRWW